MPKPTLDIIIPAYNEEKLITKTVSACLKIKKYKTTVLVIIDGKTNDSTAKMASSAGAKVIRTKEKSGKGAVFRKAFPHLTADYIVQIDADHQFQPQEIAKHVEALRKGADITLGTRYEQGSMIETYSVSFLKLLGSFFLSYVTSLFASQKITDVMAGFKGFRKAALLSINPQTDHFGYEAEMVIKAAQQHLRIQNIPITYTARAVGSSSVNSIKHGVLVLSTIIKTGLK